MFIKKTKHIDADNQKRLLPFAKADVNSLIVWVICIALFGIFYWRLRHIGPVTLEDYYMITYTKSFFSWRDSLAISQGRVSYFISSWLWAISFFRYSLLKYQIFRMFWTALCLFSVWRLVRDLTNKAIAQLTVLLSLTFFVVQINQHNLLFSYPGFLHVPFSFMILGLDTQLRYLKTNKKRWMILTVPLVFISGFCQEVFLLEYLMYAWMAFGVYYMKSNIKDWKGIISKTLRSLIPIILTGVIIVALYIAWKVVHPGDYAGSSFSWNSRKNILMTWFSLMNGMFPLRTAIHHIYDYADFSILNNIGILDVVTSTTSVLGLTLSCVQIRKQPSISVKKNILILLGCALGCALAPALHALTENYVGQFLRGIVYSYTISFFCYFFIMSSFAILLSIVCHKKEIGHYRGCVFTCTIVVFIASMINSASNNYALARLQRESDAGNAAVAFFRSEENRDLCINRTLYIQSNDIIQAPLISYSVLTVSSELGVGNQASIVKDSSLAEKPYPDNTVWLTYDGEAFHVKPLS